MAIQSSFYSGTALDSRQFPTTKHIATKQHMAVWKRLTIGAVWEQLDINEYELINNSAVLTQLISTSLYDNLEVRVADSPNELVSSPSDISIVAGIADEIVIVAGIEAEVVTVSGDSAAITTVAGDTIVINTVAGDTASINIVAGDTTEINIVAGDTIAINLVADDLAKGIGTNQPTDSAILNALTNADTAIAQATIATNEATDSAASASASQLSAWEAEADEMSAQSNASEAVDVFTKTYTSLGNGSFSSVDNALYSALHYQIKASESSLLIPAKTSARNTVISSPNGVHALATTPTKSFDTSIYTGNGISQNIITGIESKDPNWVSADSYVVDQIILYDYVIYKSLTVHTGVVILPDVDATNWLAVGANVHVPFFNSSVWPKGRSGATSNKRVDTLRGTGKSLVTDTTAIETLEATGVTSFNVDGFSIGADLDYNTNLATYVAWQTQYDTMFYGTTNQGKAFVTAYNAQSGDGESLYVGSGVTGNEIPHGLGTEKVNSLVKSRDGISSWYYSDNDLGYGQLNENIAFSTPAFNVSDSNSLSLGSASSEINGNNVNYVAYFSSNRANHTYAGSYTGTGVAGNVVDFGLDMTPVGAKVMIKSLGSAGGWVILDNVRGVTQFLYADVSNAEGTATLITFTSTGVIIQSTSTDLNTSGIQYLIEAVIPNYDKPNGGLDVNADNVISYAEGTDNTSGDLDAIEVTALETLSLISGVKNYVTVSKGDVKATTDVKLLKGFDRVSADKWGVVSPSDVTLKTTDKHSDYASATGIVSVKSVSATAYGYKMFDKDNTTFWNGTLGFANEEVIYSFNEPRIFKSLGINYYTSGDKAIDISYSIDGGVTYALDQNFETLGAVAGTTYRTNIVANTLEITNIKIEFTVYLGGTNAVINELELNTEHASGDFYNVQEGIMYDSTDTPTSKIYTGEVVVDGIGEVIPDTLVEYAVKHVDMNELEVHGDTVFHGDISGAKICNAFVSFKMSGSVPIIISSEGINSLIRIAAGTYELDIGNVDNLNYALLSQNLNVGGANAPIQLCELLNSRVGNKVTITTNQAATEADINNGNFSVFIIGGKN